MTENEQSQMLAYLRGMQEQMEDVVNNDMAPCIMIEVPGASSHTLSGQLAINACRSLARTFENERLDIMQRRKKSIINR